MSEEERYRNLANERQNALDTSNRTYEDLLNQNTQYSNSVNDYLNKYQNTQNEVYDKQTQFQVDLQNQNKEKAEREYQREAMASKNAYYDFINPYGVQREIQAQNGLQNSGYSETTKSQAWTTQQNRTAQARATMNESKLQFDNAIKEAYLNNDVNKANLALQILQQQQEEALRSFNYVSTTKQNQLSNNQGLDSDYNNRYNTLYNQIQQEKATQEAIRQWEAEMAEKQRQYNETMAYQREQDRIAQEQWEKQYELSKKKVVSSGSSGSSRGSYSLTNGSSSNSTSKPVSSSGGATGSILGSSLPKSNNYSGAVSGSIFGTALGSIAQDKTYSAKNTPSKFSSNAAKNWYSSNISGKNFTSSQLESALTSAYNKGTISKNDVASILKVYGLS